MTEQEIKQNLKSWVLKKSNRIQESELTEDTLLLESRIITSLQIMELILEIERIKGGRIDIKSIKPGVFKSINSIYQGFFV